MGNNKGDTSYSENTISSSSGLCNHGIESQTIINFPLSYQKIICLFDDYDMHNYSLFFFDLNLIYLDKNIQGIDRYMKCKCANKILTIF